jgi:hypothetical protein
MIKIALFYRNLKNNTQIMKFYTALFFLFYSYLNVQSQNVLDYSKTIQLDELKDKLYTYSSDEFEGREAGKKGQTIAVEYLKEHYIKNNIESLINDTYFQNVPLKSIQEPEVSITVNNKEFVKYDDYVILSAGENNFDVKSKQVIYVGYGINDSIFNDYENIDVKNKIVIAIKGEPKNQDGKYIITENLEQSKWSKRGSFTLKKQQAIDLGAVAFLYIDEDMLKRYGDWYKRRGHEDNERLELDVISESKESIDIPSFYIGETIANEIIINKKKSLPTSSQKIKTKIKINYDILEKKIKSQNVAAIIKGSEFPEEYIIITAHLDHVGMSDGEVYNGADDDGSGTVAIMQISEAFQKAVKDGYGPRRSIIFLHMTAEEKGLLGSKYYTNYDPIVPLKNTVTNLNIDMIGRIDPNREEKNRNYIYLIGSDIISQDLHDVSEEIAKKYSNLVLDYRYNDPTRKVFESGRYIENRYYYRSDHYNFAEKNIPIIFYFSGTHEDYHKPTDTVDKIEFDLLQQRTKLIFHTAWELANRNERIQNKIIK